MADRFYVNSPLAPGLLPLPAEEAHHLATVRRFVVGDRIMLFNGDGAEYPAVIESIARKSAVVQVLERIEIDRELPFTLTIATALPKGDRVDYLVEKLTELGVTQLVPLQTARSIVQPRDSRLDKLQRAVIEASKQCGRNRLMRVSATQRWEAVLAASNANHCYLAHPTEAAISLGTLRPERVTAITVAIGPEGGFTEAEVAAAREHGWQTISLGPRILRIETACVQVASWIAATV